MIVFLIPIVILAIVIISMCIGGLVVAIAGAMFLETPFSDGWHTAWEHPGYLAIFSLLVLPALINNK